MKNEVVEVTFKNVTKNQEITARLVPNKKDSCDVTIDFGDIGADEHVGMHVAYLDAFMMSMFDVSEDS